MALPDGERPNQKTLRLVCDIKGDALLLAITNRNYYFQARDTLCRGSHY
ncbi:hypothetical protein HHS34_002535 [Acidithiobacillus montserratensis]|uniref:Uncharacterized protein n=1 Tax=Acidithiobacillus montserratensis TaxID=2729135 RepID=A0ACD5HGN3_9PROT|nr:hypothetical protein [Acidithiobacillus montserratensis]MBU2747605.1 hypothetical protein [Acidithiobacillus montserratensis]